MTESRGRFIGELYRLPKVISEMVGQPCRFAATTRRSSPTISEISFGSHSRRLYSVQGRAGVSPAPLGCQSERPESKILAHHFLAMPAAIARSNQTCCPAGQAGRLPYFLLHTRG